MAGLNVAQIIDRARQTGVNLSNEQADGILKQTFSQSIYGADPGKVDALIRTNYSSPGFTSPGSGGSTGGSTDPKTYIDQAVNAFKRANEPAISNLRATIPEQQKMFKDERTRLEGQVGTIKDRYKNLIDSIKGNQKVAETRQTTTTNNELARRGITNDSGVFEQEMTNAVNPITQQYTGIAKDAAISQEEDLQDNSARITGLTNEESAAIRSILGNIAGLESGAANSGISTGLSLFSQDRTREDQLRASEAEKALQEADRAFKEKQFQESIRQFNTQEGRLGQKDDGGIGSLLSMFGGLQNQTPQKTVIGRLPDGRYLWSDGTAGWTGGK
jgi:hypothetical protein